MATGGVNLGNAYGKISIDASGVNKGVSQAQRGLAGFQKAAGVAFTGVAAAGAALGAVVSEAADFEQSMADLAAVSGVTGKQFDDLQAMAIDMGNTTAFSAKEAADGMTFLAMAGFETDQIMDAIPGTLNLAAAGNLDLAESADIASNVLTGMGMEAGEMNRVADVLAATASRTNTNVQQLGEAFSYAAPNAAALGLSVEQTSAAIGIMSDAGIQASSAGTALNSMLQSLASPTNSAKVAMRDLGINVYDAQGNIRDFPSILEDFRGALDGLTEQEQAEKLNDIFNARGLRGFRVLLSDSSKDLSTLSSELENAGGAAERMAKRRLETLQGQLKLLQSALSGVAIEMGNELLPVLTSLVRDVLTPMIRTHGPAIVQQMGHMVDGLKSLIGPVNTVMGALEGINDALPGTADSFGETAKQVGDFIYTLSPLKPAIEGGAAGLDALGASTEGAVQRVRDSSEYWQAAEGALRNYNDASEEVQAAQRDQAATLRGLLDEQEADLRLRAEMAQRGEQDSAAWQENTERINARTEAINEARAALENSASAQADERNALQMADSALGKIRSALYMAADAQDDYAESIDLTKEQIKEFREQLEEARTGGLDAFSGAIENEVGFLDDRVVSQEDFRNSLQEVEAKSNADLIDLEEEHSTTIAEQEQKRAKKIQDLRQKHADKLSDMEFKHTQKMERLQAADEPDARKIQEERENYARAIAEETRDIERAIAEQNTALSQGVEQERASYQERKQEIEEWRKTQNEELQAAFDEQERIAAQEYAMQQAAQMAHLGQMLIDYTVAQGKLHGVSDEAIAQMTARLREEYGVQQSVVERSYGVMTTSIDEWARNGGENADEYVGHMRTIQDETVTLQQRVDEAINRMVDEATAAYQRGEMGPKEFAARLQEIPAEAERSVQGTNAALSALPTSLAAKQAPEEYIRVLGEMPGAAQRAVAQISVALAKIPTEITTQHDVKQAWNAGEAAMNEARQQAKANARRAVRAVRGYADGGVIPAGETAMVGEVGPELITPVAATRVIPTADIAAGASSAAPSMNASVTVNVGSVDTPQRASEVGAEVRRAIDGLLAQMHRGVDTALPRLAGNARMR